MSRDLTLSMKLYADATRFVSGLTSGENGVRKFSSTAKREFDALKGSLNSVEGKLASIGVTIGATAAIMQSANLDRELTLLKLSAGASADETARLRKELFNTQNQYGANLDELKGGVDALIAGGLSMKEATASVEPMGRVLLIAKTNANALGKAMGVASKQFDIDLSNPKETSLLLDKMVVAGRLGNAELENLPDIFARIGGNAKLANLDLDKTLALTETLSLFEPDANRLGTLADSTLRVFTNANYLKNAQQGTGVKFFDKDGSRRDPLIVLSDIEKKYKSLKTQADKFSFTSKAFGQSDETTIKGLQALLAQGSLEKLSSNLSGIKNASGTAAGDVNEALKDATQQTARLKGALREAADEFAKPINGAVANIIKMTMADKKDGGLGMDGNDMLLAGGGGALATILAARYGGKAIGSIAGKFGNMGAGVATGKALETAAGVTPVYVVNMGEGGMGLGTSAAAGGGVATAGKIASKFKVGAALLGGSNMAALRMMGVGAMSTAGLGVTAAGVAGYGAGSLVNKGIEGTFLADAIGRSVAIAMAPFSADARNSLKNEFNSKSESLSGTLNIRIDQDGRFAGASVKTNKSDVKLNVANGLYMFTDM